MSFIQEIIDVHDDVAAGLKIAKEDMKKISSYNVRPDIESLPDRAFALNLITKTGSVVRKYPLKTADDTALSVHYFTKVAENILPEPVRRIAATFIKAACGQHGVSVTGVVDKWADDTIGSNTIKLAEVDDLPAKVRNVSPEDHALILDDGTMKYPIDTPERVKIAAGYFRENWKLIDPSWRRQMADNITKKASALSVDLPHDDVEQLEQYAGDRYSKILKVAVHERKNALQHQPEAIRVLDNLMEKKASLKPMEFARSLEAFDQRHGLDQYWDSEIIDPYQSTFGGVKIAQPVYVRGKTIAQEKIAALATDEDSLKKHFDSNFIKDFQQQPVEIFQSLPTPDQELMITLMKD